jgi:hypothetical protein
MGHIDKHRHTGELKFQNDEADAYALRPSAERPGVGRPRGRGREIRNESFGLERED